MARQGGRANLGQGAKTSFVASTLEPCETRTIPPTSTPVLHNPHSGSVKATKVQGLCCLCAVDPTHERGEAHKCSKGILHGPHPRLGKVYWETTWELGHSVRSEPPPPKLPGTWQKKSSPHGDKCVSSGNSTCLLRQLRPHQDHTYEENGSKGQTAAHHEKEGLHHSKALVCPSNIHQGARQPPRMKESKPALRLRFLIVTT